MSFTLPELPYDLNALEPHISEETLKFHYEKHHAGYVKKLNNQLEGSGFEDKSIEEIIKNADPGGLFNNAAQVWNHTFYWHSMTPGKTEPSGELLQAINDSFGSLDKLREKFEEVALGTFGSGWAWLTKDGDKSLKIVSTKDADTPVRTGGLPLLTCDVWEHAYYIDYRNDRGKYFENFWKLVNWDFAAENYETEDITLRKAS